LGVKIAAHCDYLFKLRLIKFSYLLTYLLTEAIFASEMTCIVSRERDVKLYSLTHSLMQRRYDLSERIFQHATNQGPSNKRLFVKPTK